VESGKPVRIGEDQVSFVRDGEERSARYEVKSGEFWMHFESPEGKKSYTVYQYEKVPAGFRIYREDPYIRESYTFKLK
jgi:hypothetical protein